MKTTAEMIAVMQAFADGKPIEFRDVSLAHAGWMRINLPSWNWQHLDYRVAVTPMTIPWVILNRDENGASDVIGAARDENGQIYVYKGRKPEARGRFWALIKEDEDAGYRIDGLISGIDPGTCDWKDSWIDNPFYEGERA